MTSLSTAKSLILITQNINPDATQLAHVLLANDEALPADIKAGLSKTLLTIRPLEPFSRLDNLVIEILAVTRPEFRGVKGFHARHVACWDEIDAMGKKATVSNALLWFSMICNVVSEDPDIETPVVLH